MIEIKTKTEVKKKEKIERKNWMQSDKRKNLCQRILFQLLNNNVNDQPDKWKANEWKKSRKENIQWSS